MNGTVVAAIAVIGVVQIALQVTAIVQLVTYAGRAREPRQQEVALGRHHPAR